MLLDVALEALIDLRGAERPAGGAARAARLRRGAAAGLRARSRVHRERAAETLSALATPAALRALEAGLADRYALVRTAAARTLAVEGDDRVIPAVVAIAQRDMAGQPGAAAAVVLALGTKRPEALAPLLADGAPPAVRNVTVTLVGDLRLPLYAPELHDCLAGDDALAASAARGLERIGSHGSGHDPGGRGAVGQATYLQPLGDTLFQVGDVADDADDPAAVAQVVDDRHHLVEGLVVQ